jgi:hypothetical protein
MKKSSLKLGFPISFRKAALLCCLVLLLGFILVDSKRYANLADSQLISFARANNWTLSIENSDMSLFGYTAAALHARPINSFVGISLTNVEAGPQLLPLSRARWGTSLSANLLGGTLDSTFEGSLSGKSLHISADARGVAAAAHPVLEGFGLRSGTFDIRIRDLLLENDLLSAGTFELELRNISKPEATQLPLRASGMNIELAIPIFTRLNGTLKCQLTAPTAECSFDISSSLLKANGKLMLSFEGTSLAQQRLNSSIELQEDGATAFSKFLPLISGGRLKEGDRNFSFRTSGSPRAPSFIFEPTLNKLGTSGPLQP